jgi:hypothetical protein
MIQKINPRPVVLVAMILAVGIFRVVTATTHSTLAGFTPLGAMALFAGFYFRDRWKAYIVPLLTLWLSDIMLNRYLFFGEWVFFYNSFEWVYASFALIVYIGRRVVNASVKNLVVASVATAVVHMLISNAGVWLYGCGPGDSLYSADVKGLLECYSMSLPSMVNFFIGNLFFCSILFGGFEFMQKRFVVLQYQS